MLLKLLFVVSASIGIRLQDSGIPIPANLSATSIAEIGRHYSSFGYHYVRELRKRLQKHPSDQVKIDNEIGRILIAPTRDPPAGTDAKKIMALQIDGLDLLTEQGNDAERVISPLLDSKWAYVRYNALDALLTLHMNGHRVNKSLKATLFQRTKDPVPYVREHAKLVWKILK